MNRTILFLALGVFPGSLSGPLSGSAQQNTDRAVPVRVSHSFEFDVHAPQKEVGPLFGAEGERCWAGKHWNPLFAYPQPGKDVEGAVFTVAHGAHEVVWVNTIFDLAGGRMQYVAVIPKIQAFMVDVKLSLAGPAVTHVGVTYTRTALDTAENDTVTAMGKTDSESGPDWQRSIESFLKSGNARACGAAK
jgi:hypothetical protein